MVGHGTVGGRVAFWYKERGFFKVFNEIIFEHIDFQYPPLNRLSYLPMYALFGPNTKNVLLINSVYLAILVFSVYKIGEHIYSKKHGLFAAFIIATVPLIIFFSRSNFNEFLLLSLTALSYYLLLKTNHFQNRKYCVFLGLAIGFAALSRYEALVYVGTPVFINLIFSYKRTYLNKKLTKLIVTNLLIIIVLSLSICGVWYARNIGSATTHLKERYQNPNEIQKKDYSFLSINNFVYHFKVMLYPNLSLTMGFLFFVSLFSFLFKKIKFEEKLLLSSFFIPYLFLLLVPIFDETLFAPAYYLIPLFISRFVFDIKKNIVRNIILILVLFQGITLFISPFLNIQTYLLGYKNEIGFYESFNYFDKYRGLKPPSQEPHFAERMYEYILNDTNNKSNIKILLFSVPDDYFWILKQKIMISDFDFNSKLYAFYYLNEYRYDKYGSGDSKWLHSLEYRELVGTNEFDYIVIVSPSEYISDKERVKYYIYSYEILALSDLSNNYERILTAKDSEKEVIVYLYKRNSD